jgi:molecular chaperone HscB
MHISDMTLSDTDYTLFGLPRTYHLDYAALSQAYLKLQRMAHPDRHVQGSAQEQRMAIQWTTRINQAYARLKNPIERAVYWCELHGETPKTPTIPLAKKHLIQHMAWHEALSELQNNTSPEALEALNQEVKAAQANLYAQLTQAADHNHDTALACQCTQALLYIHKFIQELDNTLARLEDTL